MAFDDQGAFWLSESEKILNPYFGKAMRFCGEVTETYLKGKKVIQKGGPAQQKSGGQPNH
jgi:Cu(I)/Ag(I) efflux system membrane fusion protein